ncbi:diacylglycerol/lipid kinase family protein [Salmonirosea aquatica]|uniref:diacylglycerol/lipid kinase family protein n=1 Tax=Salmonirosea aquatica TaxID=2654236 RepID=UPI00357155A6
MVNPHSGTKLRREADSMAVWLEQQARKAGLTAKAIITRARGHATDLAAEAAATQKWDTVVAVGGDGTVNEVARGLLFAPTSLGILPLGSGNGLARHLGIPLTLSAALHHLFECPSVVIDSATLNGQPFFCVAGLGFDAYVGQLFGQQPRRGLDTYVRVSMQAYLDYLPQRIRVAGRDTEIFSLSFANAGQFGNNAWVAPHADLTDGRLEVCTVTPFPKWYGTALTFQLFTKGLKPSTYISYQSLREITVETEQPTLVHYDGEPWQLDTGRIEVKIVPKSLRVKA